MTIRDEFEKAFRDRYDRFLKTEHTIPNSEDIFVWGAQYFALKSINSIDNAYHASRGDNFGYEKWCYKQDLAGIVRNLEKELDS